MCCIGNETLIIGSDDMSDLMGNDWKGNEVHDLINYLEENNMEYFGNEKLVDIVEDFLVKLKRFQRDM